MPKLKDRTGKRFHRLTVVSYAGIKQKQASWLCHCSCGNFVVVRGGNLQSGHTNSCGCLNTESSLRVSHGDYNTRFYIAWRNMKARVESKRVKSSYLDKGIILCLRWLEYKNFKEDMYSAYVKHIKDYGEKNTTLDRKDNSKGYNLINCRWATWVEQANNRGY